MSDPVPPPPPYGPGDGHQPDPTAASGGEAPYPTGGEFSTTPPPPPPPPYPAGGSGGPQSGPQTGPFPPPATPYGQAPYAGAPSTRNQKAVIGLVLSILGIVFAFCCSIIGVVLGIGGAVVGHLAKQEIAVSGDQSSAGMAQAAFITGLVAAGLGVIMMILSLVFRIGVGSGVFGT